MGKREQGQKRKGLGKQGTQGTGEEKKGKMRKGDGGNRGRKRKDEW
jgi:hypothetical protein